MPIGGNHFTRQLTKELKLTFAKAEHLKRNARLAEDPKLVFQAMRPVFNDLVTEVQRSVGFFQQQNRSASVENLLICGNAVKLPGLVAYLGKSLGYEVQTLDHFLKLSGPEVLQNPTFKDNLPTFGVCYGLCLQALGRGAMRSSLVPKEIVTERLIRAKKPWALAGVAALMFGLMGHYVFLQRNWSVVHEEKWKASGSSVDATKQTSTTATQTDAALEAKRDYLIKVGNELAGNYQRRLLWPELLKTINAQLPRNPEYPTGQYPFPSEYPYEKRPDIYVTSIETQSLPDVAGGWFNTKKEHWQQLMRDWNTLTGKPLPMDIMTAPGPTGPGWIVQLRCYHYFNADRRTDGIKHVRTTLFENLMFGKVQLPVRRIDPTGKTVEVMEEFTVEQMGISYPIILLTTDPVEVDVPNPEYEPPVGGAMAGNSMSGGIGGYGSGSGESSEGMMSGYPSAMPGAVPGAAPGAPKIPPTIKAKKFDFVMQFCWQPKNIEERDKIKEEMLKKQEQLQQQQQQNAAGSVAMAPQ